MAAPLCGVLSGSCAGRKAFSAMSSCGANMMNRPAQITTETIATILSNTKTSYAAPVSAPVCRAAKGLAVTCKRIGWPCCALDRAMVRVK